MSDKIGMCMFESLYKCISMMQFPIEQVQGHDLGVFETLPVAIVMLFN